MEHIPGYRIELGDGSGTIGHAGDLANFTALSGENADQQLQSILEQFPHAKIALVANARFVEDSTGRIIDNWTGEVAVEPV